MKITRRKFLATSLMASLGGLSADAFWWERLHYETKRFSIGIQDDPAASLKAVQLTDLHLKKLESSHFQLAEQLSQLQPDLILLTGDVIDRGKNLPLVEELLKLLPRQAQKVAIVGNWEHSALMDLRKIRQIYERFDTPLLINRSEAFQIGGKRLMITGVDDLIRGWPNFPEAVREVGYEANHLVLAHCPAYWDKLKLHLQELNPLRPPEQRLKIDYVFSGHTHGGQINLFGWCPHLPRGTGGYVQGWFRQEQQPSLYVSRGFGTTILPARFGARAEVTVFDYGLR